MGSRRRQDRRRPQDEADAGGNGGEGREPSDLSQLLDIIEDVAAKNGEVSFGRLYDAIGHRSFGPLLLVAGIIVLMPFVGDIPGVPTIMGAVVMLIAAQLFAHRKQFWLPRRVLNASLRSGPSRPGHETCKTSSTATCRREPS